jgi:transposase
MRSFRERKKSAIKKSRLIETLTLRFFVLSHDLVVGAALEDPCFSLFVKIVFLKTMNDVNWGRVSALRAIGFTVRDVVKETKIKRSTVHRLSTCGVPSQKRRAKAIRGNPPAVAKRRRAVKKLWKEEVSRVGTKGKSGRAKSITRVMRTFPNPHAIAREMTRKGHSISPSTVRRDLHAMNIIARRRPRGPRRKEGDTEKRIEFCKGIIEGGMDTSKIFFSDEKITDVNDHGSRYDWVIKGTPARHLEKDRWAPSVHVWGVIGLGFKRLIMIPKGTTVNSDSYIKTLTEVLPVLKTGVLMQDGARAHQSAKTLDWLTKKKVSVLSAWPPRSCDLNPIEDLWSIVQYQVDLRGPTNCEELIKFWTDCWEAIPQATVDRLVLSFTKRCEACLSAGGETLQKELKAKQT